MIDQMFAVAHDLDEHAADALADALPYMLATTLESADAASLECSSRLTLLHRHRIQQFAREHLCDPRLDAKMIADGVNLSTRRVYELFDPSSASLMKWVWHERLERCRRDLGTAALRARPIGAIAFAWGFSDICHFSRTFKRRYGMTPSEWRTTRTEPA